MLTEEEIKTLSNVSLFGVEFKSKVKTRILKKLIEDDLIKSLNEGWQNQFFKLTDHGKQIKSVINYYEQRRTTS